jgi:multicomponent Na+:H+ antiporter subunit F
MNLWMIAASVLLFGLVPCGIASFKGKPLERLIGLEMAAIVTTLLLVILAEALGNPNLYDLALAEGLLAFGGGLVFVRFLERWL